MFGDTITDLGAMIQGGLGLAPGANINPKGTSMFDPIHGSAPKYRELGVANPITTIRAGSLLPGHIGEHEAAAAVVSAIEKSIRDGVVIKDMGGSASTSKAGSYIAESVNSWKKNL
jgi:3-isopropylmalate dehydrogenase